MVDIEKCQITHYPAEVLAKRAQPVEKIDDNIHRLVEKMIDIMLENKGVGLAGPQIGVSLRIFVVCLDGKKENAKVYINPEIETGGQIVEEEEGCLSLPGIYGKIRRFSQCKVTATDLNGNRFTEDATGLPARAFQHEFDHLEGRMVKDRLSVAAKLRARRRLNKLKEEYENNH